MAVIALPLAMALGIGGGASPDKGLLTAIVSGFFISLLGRSRTQIGGPTGARTLEPLFDEHGTRPPLAQDYDAALDLAVRPCE